MRCVLIGSGRLATNLGHALMEAGHKVEAVYSRTLSNAQELCNKIGGYATDHPHELPMESDIFIVSLKDDALPEMLPKLTQGRKGQMFVHTAGSLPMNIFHGRTDHYGVLYPMQTFSNQRQVNFSEISLFLEASDMQSMARIKMLADTLSQHVYELDSEGRKQLHLAAVFACNFVNHCLAMSAEVLKDKGLPFSIMLPLVDETIMKIHEIEPMAAQTGPAVRGDSMVMQMHCNMLSDKPALKRIYEDMSKDIQRLAEQ